MPEASEGTDKDLNRLNASCHAISYCVHTHCNTGNILEGFEKWKHSGWVFNGRVQIIAACFIKGINWVRTHPKGVLHLELSAQY